MERQLSAVVPLLVKKILAHAAGTKRLLPMTDEDQDISRVIEFVQRGQRAQTAVEAPTDLRSVDDATLISGMVREMPALGLMELSMEPSTVLQLVGILQLASRNPMLARDAPQACDVIERFLTSARLYFDACPSVLEVMRRGSEQAPDTSTS